MSEQILMFPEQHVAFCGRHLEPFRAEWPSGYAILCLAVLRQVLALDKFDSRFDSDPATGELLLDIQKATQVLVDLSPLCCLLGDDTMTLLTAEALGIT